jgi:hypothetical protein
MEDGKILGFSDYYICLYCGKPIEGRYDDCDMYYKCECPDAKKKRDIEKQIDLLKQTIPKEKFFIESERVLYKKKR